MAITYRSVGGGSSGGGGPRPKSIGTGWINPLYGPIINQGTWAALSNATGMTGFYYNSSATNGDSISYDIYLYPGTYTLYWTGPLTATSGIVSTYLNGSVIADSIDYYNGAANYNHVESVAAIEITAEGIQTLTFTVVDTNTASGIYGFALSGFEFRRTA